MNSLSRSALVAWLALSSLSFAQQASPPPAAPAAAAAAAAAPVPAPEEALKVWTYFNKGQGQGPVLVEAKLCTEVGKEGANKFECTVEAANINAKTTLLLWTAWLVPQGDTIEDITVQVKQGNVVRETKDMKVKGESWRTRTWIGISAKKPGQWSAVVMRGEQVLKEVKFSVAP